MKTIVDHSDMFFNYCTTTWKDLKTTLRQIFQHGTQVKFQILNTIDSSIGIVVAEWIE